MNDLSLQHHDEICQDSIHPPTYLHHHHQLKELWLVQQNVFSYLSPSDQLALHKYFQFASDKSEIQLVEHRHNVHALDPSLPHQAGRAYAKIMRGTRAPAHYAEMPNGRRVSVRAIMRPEPDVQMLARTFFRMALDERKGHDDRAA